MSVDFFDCTICGESICECGSFTQCENCGHKFCDDCHPGYVNKDGEDINFDYSKKNIKGANQEYKDCCPICSKKTILDGELLEFIIKKYKLKRKKEEEDYRNA